MLEELGDPANKKWMKNINDVRRVSIVREDWHRFEPMSALLDTDFLTRRERDAFTRVRDSGFTLRQKNDTEMQPIINRALGGEAFIDKFKIGVKR